MKIGPARKQRLNRTDDIPNFASMGASIRPSFQADFILVFDSGSGTIGHADSSVFPLASISANGHSFRKISFHPLDELAAAVPHKLGCHHRRGVSELVLRRLHAARSLLVGVSLGA